MILLYLEDFRKQYVLVDLDYMGDDYTSKNNGLKGAFIKQRFGWVLVSNGLRLLHSRANTKHLIVLNSDHKPILL